MNYPCLEGYATEFIRVPYRSTDDVKAAVSLEPGRELRKKVCTVETPFPHSRFLQLRSLFSSAVGPFRCPF